MPIGYSRITNILPRPLWILSVSVVLMTVAIGLQFGIPIWRQQAAMRWIDSVRGHCATEERGPAWLRHWFIDDDERRIERRFGIKHRSLFDEAVAVMIGGPRIRDADLSHLEGLTSLRRLILHGDNITDDGLSHLKRLPRLHELVLTNTSVTDAGLLHLHKMTELSVLELKNTKITDAGIAELTQLPQPKVGNHFFRNNLGTFRP